MVAAGAGRRLRAGSSPRAIAAAVGVVLGDGSYRAAAGRMAEVIAADVAEDRAVSELESLAAGHPSARLEAARD